MNYKASILGRRHEQDLIREFYESPKAELVAVYGRRRVGKTYLVRQYFDNDFDFYFTGSFETPRSTQIDLVIDRRDETVNLCECKFSNDTYSISQEYAERLNSRKETFRAVTGTRKSLHTTMVTTYGLKRNKYSETAQREVTMDDLFRDVE